MKLGRWGGCLGLFLFFFKTNIGDIEKLDMGHPVILNGQRKETSVQLFLLKVGFLIILEHSKLQ